MKKLIYFFFSKGFIIPIVCMCVLLAKCFITSGKKYMWMDEILTYLPASLSFGGMMSFISDKINAGNYLYFITIWGWAKIFTTSALSLRLFSSIGFCLSVFLTWITLKRVYGLWSASIAIIIVFLNSSLILSQNAEARFYGMLFALVSTLFYVTVYNINKTHTDRKTLIFLFLINGALPLTHLFGFVYSILFLFAVVIVDYRKGHLRPSYYISSLTGWLLFLPFIPAFTKTLELSQPHFWIPIPEALDLKHAYFKELKIYIKAGIVLVFCVHIFLKNRRAKQYYDDYVIILIATFSLLLPATIWIYSQFFKSLFIMRYMIIFELGLLILISASISRLLKKENILTTIQKSILAVLLCGLIIDSTINNETSFFQVSIGEEDFFPAGIPVVADSPHSYLPRSHYNPLHRDYYFILDWEVAINPENTLNASQDFQVMQALKHHLPDQNIMSTDDFLSKFSKFIVLPSQVWFYQRIMDDQRFKIEEIRQDIYMVQRK